MQRGPRTRNANVYSSDAPQPWILFGACCLVQVGILIILGPIKKDLFWLQLSFHPEDARKILASWMPEDVERFSHHFLLDGLYPVLYGLLLRRRARALLPHSPLSVTLIGAATLGAACDVVENVLHWSALPDLDHAADWMLRAASGAAILKWLLMWPLVLLLAPHSPLMAKVGPMTIPFDAASALRKRPRRKAL